MKVDYIVVGLGIAGLAICEELERRGKSFVVFNVEEHCATAASGGIINPTILKRFTVPWKTATFYPRALDFYKGLEEKLGLPIFETKSIFRIFHSVEEQNNWFSAGDKDSLKEYLKSEVIENRNNNLQASYGLGEVSGALKIDIPLLLTSYKLKLEKNGFYFNEDFNFDQLQTKEKELAYKNIRSTHIISCEGPKAVFNPFFPKDAFVGNKGEYIIIHSKDLKEQNLIKGNHYIIPLGNDRYKVGATFELSFDNWDSSEEKKSFLVSELERMISCSFEVEGQTAGVRATTRDHKPILGVSGKDDRIAFINGLGTRGLMMAPLLSEILLQKLEDGKEIPSEMNLSRFL